MKPGVSFVRAVLKEGSRTALREINREWLDDEERLLYDFVQTHVREYGQLPSAMACEQNGFVIKTPREPSRYYADRLRKRTAYNAILDNLEAFRGAMDEHDIDRAINILSMMLGKARHVAQTNAVVALREGAIDLLNRIHETRMGGDVFGIPTGYETLDLKTQGMQPGDVWLIAGRPSIGKSYKLSAIMQNVWHAGYSPFWCSMEMSVEQSITRVVALEAGLNPRYLRSGQVSAHRLRDFTETIRFMERANPIHFLAGSVSKTVADFDVMMQETEADVGFIDAGYLLQPERKRQRSGRREIIADVIEEVKEVAIKRKKPIVVSVQLARTAKETGKPKEGKGKRKELDLVHLAETDAMGQIASVAVGIQHGAGALSLTTRNAQIMKNRDGEPGEYDYNFRFSPPNFDQIFAAGMGHNGGPPLEGETVATEEDEDYAQP